MAVKQSAGLDGVLKRLDAIDDVLRDLLIIQAKRAGIKKSSARAIAGVADARVSRIWREIGKAKSE